MGKILYKYPKLKPKIKQVAAPVLHDPNKAYIKNGCDVIICEDIAIKSDVVIPVIMHKYGKYGSLI
jgi:hypothetical protein